MNVVQIRDIPITTELGQSLIMHLTKNNPLITIIIPVYNAEKLIAGCIESIIQQNVEYWNLILVNDGSSDKSGKYVKNMLNKTVASL